MNQQLTVRSRQKQQQYARSIGGTELNMSHRIPMDLLWFTQYPGKSNLKNRCSNELLVDQLRVCSRAKSKTRDGIVCGDDLPQRASWSLS